VNYPNQPRPRGGWPQQPPPHSRQSADRDGYTPGGYGQDDYGDDFDGHGPGGGGRDDYGQAGYARDDYGPGDIWRNDHGQQDFSSPRRRRRGRGAGITLGILIVLAVALVVGDRMAKSYAQNMIATKIQAQGNMSSKPSVTIQGFPFLTQVAARDVKTVDISASNFQENKVEVASLRATATGVHLTSSFNGATIDQINGTALVTLATLDSELPIPGGARITPDPSAGPNGVSVALAGGAATATGQVMLTSPTEVTVKIHHLGGLAGLLGGAAGQRSYNLTIPALPIGLQVTGLSMTGQGVVFTAVAHNTTLGQ